MKAIAAFNEKQIKNVPELKPGDTVKVHTKIIEGNKERIQVFEGVVIRVKGAGIKQTFTVRKLSYGIGVERTFLIHSPKLAKIQIMKRAKVRRAYLTYLRELRGKAAKLRDKSFDALAVNVQEVELKPEDLAPPTPEEGAEEKLDEEITELNVDEDVETAEASTDEVVAEENAEAQTDAGDSAENLGAEEQETSVEETEEGVAEAEKDLEKGKEMDKE